MMEFYKNKRILITGHTGFKGAWLCKILLYFGANILGYSLECQTEPSLFKLLNLENKMKSVIGDIRDFNKLSQTIIEFKPEIIIHLASQALVNEANVNPRYTYDTNIIGIVNLLESIKQCDSVKSVINVSTDTVYLIENKKEYYKETDTIGGNNNYSNSKSCAESIISNYKRTYFYNKEYPRISNTRSVNIIGGGDFNKSRIVPECVSAWLENRNIEIKSPNNIRPFLHVLESLYGYLLIAKKQYEDKKYEGDYNFGPSNDGYISIGDLVNKFCKKINNSIGWINKSNENSKFVLMKTDSMKSREVLGWTSPFSLDERLQLVIDWNKAFMNKENINNITEKQIKEFFNKLD